jgi:hypothetical protein
MMSTAYLRKLSHKRSGTMYMPALLRLFPRRGADVLPLGVRQEGLGMTVLFRLRNMFWVLKIEVAPAAWGPSELPLFQEVAVTAAAHAGQPGTGSSAGLRRTCVS